MKPTDHFLGDRVSVRCRRSYRPGLNEYESTSHEWLGGTVIARDAQERRMRYVVQLDDNRRVVAFDDDVRRFTLAFEIYETLEKMAS